MEEQKAISTHKPPSSSIPTKIERDRELNRSLLKLFIVII
jgi:hypothetical protein